MPAADDSPDGFVYDAADQLRHDLKSPLTIIRGRAYLLARAVRRAPSLTDEERTRMLDGVAAIETAVTAMVVAIDALRDERAEGRGDEASGTVTGK
jgi:signal transduction histidine kinase